MSTTKTTKAELEAKVAEQAKTIDALWDLLTAISEARVPYSAEVGKDQERTDLINERFMAVRTYARLACRQDAPNIQGYANAARAEWAKPLPFTPRCMEHVEDDEWTIGGHVYPRACVLAAGHDGRHLSVPQKRERDKAAAAPLCNTVIMPSGYGCTMPSGHDGEHQAPARPAKTLCKARPLFGHVCILVDGHDGHHRTDAGDEWDELPAVGPAAAAAKEPELCDSRPFPAGSEGDDGTRCVLPAGHDGAHDDGVPLPDDETRAAWARSYAAGMFG